MMYYYLVVSSGTEIEKGGPFPTPASRDEAARETWAGLDHTVNNIFWLDVGSIFDVFTGAYMEGDL